MPSNATNDESEYSTDDLYLWWGNPFDQSATVVGPSDQISNYNHPPDSQVMPPGSNPFMIPLIDDPNVIGSGPQIIIPYKDSDEQSGGVGTGGTIGIGGIDQTTDTNTIGITADPNAGIPSTPTGGGGIFGQGSTPIPVPGISWPLAIGADLVLGGGSLGIGGNGSIANLPGAVANVVTNPIGATTTAASNIGGNIDQGTPGNIIFSGPVAPGGGNGGANPPPPSISFPPANPNGQGSGIFVTPGAIGGQVGPTAPEPTTPAPIINWPTQSPVSPTNSEPVKSTTGVVPTTGTAVTREVPTTPPPIIPVTPPPMTTGTTGEPPKIPPPIVPVTPPTSTPTPPIPPIIPTIFPSNPNPMPTTSYPQRNYYNEGLASTTAMSSLWNQLGALYGQASSGLAGSDLTNFNAMMQGVMGNNQSLTGNASAQTNAANTALRYGNIGDVNNLAGTALGINQQVNQPLYQSLGTLQGSAQNLQGQASNLSAAAGYLSPQEVAQAQQAAREGWQARGLVNSPGAVGDEILNQDALIRQRQQQAFQNQATATQGLGLATQAQQANVFNPFNTILGGQYGQQTQNVGLNTNLFNQTGQLSSGALGNQYAQQLSYPYNQYANDLYNTNVNSQGAYDISAANNAAALAAGRQVQGTNYADMFANALYGIGTQRGWFSCWVAQECLGKRNPQWIAFRHWMLNVGPKWFRALYLKHGEKFAAWLKRNAWAKPPIRAFMLNRIATLNKTLPCGIQA